ncbi:DENN domain-containing protein 1B-like [Rhinophrynus dorsalis]
MGSRIKENPERLFDGFFDVLRPESLNKDPVLKKQFPEHFDDQDSVTTLTKFCFPFDVERWENPAVQHFSFTLTDLQGYQRFGFCRLSIHSKSCSCILSCLPWFELFYKLLNNIAEYLVKEQTRELSDLLQSVYDHPVPKVNTTLSLEMLSYFVVPDPGRLPSIPENRNLTEFLVAVQVETMLHLYSSLLCERRILITSSKLSTLTACVHASAALLYPMYWQHIYIPTLPPHLLDYCSAPMPYLIGVHSSLMERLNIKSLEDVVIFNMDTNHLETPFQDLQNLPPHVVSLLKLRLRKQSALMGDGVSRAFLAAQALLFGGYRDALICNPGEPVSFCQESFLNHKCSAMRSFLQNAVHLQLFTQFIDSRLEKLNAGDGFTDIFEQEIDNCGLSGNSRSYQQWLENLKKGGGSLIHNVKSRAHPAVRNMLKYAKGHVRSGLQGTRSRIKQKDIRQFQRGGSLRIEGGLTHNHEKLQSRLPITHHFGQSRPRRPGKKCTETDSWGTQRYSQEKTSEEGVAAQEEEDELPLLEEDGMDLLEEIFETLNMRAPGEDHALYGTHSLDFFNLEDSQYFTRFQSISPTSEEDLSLSQPRDSTLWYLREEDEFSDSPEVTSLSSEVNTETPEVTSLSSEVISSTSEVASSIPDVISTYTEVIPTSTEVATRKTEVTPSTLEVISPITEVTLTYVNLATPTTEVSVSTAENISQITDIPSLIPSVSLSRSMVDSVTEEVTSQTPEFTLQTSEFAILADEKEDSRTRSDQSQEHQKEKKNGKERDCMKERVSGKETGSVKERGSGMETGSLKEQGSMMETGRKKETWDTGISKNLSLRVSGPCVKTAVSRFQSRTLDPRMMWTGTKSEETKNQRGFSAPPSNIQFPITQNNSNLKFRNLLDNTHTITPNKESTIKLSTNSHSISSSSSSKIISATNTNSATHNHTRESEDTHKPAGNSSPPSLPKVSELKKRFEV